MGRKSRKAEPSHDDPRWRPVREEFKLISQRRGHQELALLDLNGALADDRVQSMLRHIESGECERLLPEYWVAHKLSLWSDEGLLIVPRDPERRGVIPFRGVVLFLWHPDVEEVWPTLRQADDEVAPRAKPGKKPTGDWHTVIAQWLIAVAADDPKRLGNIDALVAEAAAFLEEKIDWAPAEPKHLRRKILELLQLVPR